MPASLRPILGIRFTLSIRLMRVVRVLAVVVPAAHAVSDRLAAHAVRATAAERYVFMGFLSRCLSGGEDVQRQT